ncbi:hypothetical protein HK097_008352 [Rhizophlyctis rosea]|uniref:Glutathione S-transferase n=1 Tax=Rhizophlyctis rosea TaxID=64517 RepID=A0AAD5X1R2_9FUNG|nr:hypothetical protein HK097_008352 [Rhizophlyctis rosea]
MSSAPITLYTWGTPNGHKASIVLEELGIPFEVKPIDISTNVQKEEWFLKINPNGRIPAIVDHKRGDFPVFESGAIMLYLAEHYDPEHKLFPQDANARSSVIQWLMFQMAGVGPMQGQANHFFRYAPEKIPYGIKRYQDETLRLYGVLERALSEPTADGQPRQWLSSDNKYSIADVANFSWVRIHDWSGVSLESVPKVKEWVERIAARPAVQKGLAVPESK